ncbi:hypothetical protein SCNRRL3882_6483 [Streptomyces chartreusis NRRL 3882]|uniref:Uncharacterized protein n=1 Tax=Streptomyces chartreusis NRRL 3882 TaxID=1079985 RepID=A0A2N9BI46_STRCX|nr:hypothetical protein SCNRRL3882_6483 [Streptomyces chartreusis NRRL 3882]
MPRARGLVPVRPGTSRRVTRTYGGAAPAGLPCRDDAPSVRVCVPGTTQCRASGRRTPARAVRSGPGTRKRGVHEHGSTACLFSPAPQHPATPRTPTGPGRGRPGGTFRPGPGCAASVAGAGHRHVRVRCRLAGNDRSGRWRGLRSDRRHERRPPFPELRRHHGPACRVHRTRAYRARRPAPAPRLRPVPGHAVRRRPRDAIRVEQAVHPTRRPSATAPPPHAGLVRPAGAGPHVTPYRRPCRRLLGDDRTIATGPRRPGTRRASRAPVLRAC